MIKSYILIKALSLLKISSLLKKNCLIQLRISNLNIKKSKKLIIRLYKNNRLIITIMNLNAKLYSLSLENYSYRIKKKNSLNVLNKSTKGFEIVYFITKIYILYSSSFFTDL